MSTNRIANVKTVELDSDSGPLVAIMINVDVGDVNRATEFIAEIAEAFKVHRTCSPPETAALLITIIGDLPAPIFADAWTSLQRNDQILSVYMSMMKVADVMRGTLAGQVLETVSLISNEGEHLQPNRPQHKRWWEFWK